MRDLDKKSLYPNKGGKSSKPESTLDDSTVFDDQDVDHVVKTRASGEKETTKELVSTARPKDSTARPYIDASRQEDSAIEPRTTSIFDDEDITMSQTLIKMNSELLKMLKCKMVHEKELAEMEREKEERQR
ncbi:hypothetical protein Tco_0708427 [Tanacetum coccineum]